MLGQLPRHLTRVRNAERIADLENATISADRLFVTASSFRNKNDVPKIDPLENELGKDKIELTGPVLEDDVANDPVDDTGKDAREGELTAVGAELPLIAQADAHVST